MSEEMYEDEELHYDGLAKAPSFANRLRNLAAGHVEKAQAVREARHRAVRAMADQLRSRQEFEDDLDLLRNEALRQTDRRLG